LEEEKEPTPEETEAAEKPQEVPKRGTDEETSGGTKDRTGEQRLAVRRHRQRKKRAQVNGEPRQKFSAARGRFTRRAVPAMCKGHVRRGPGMKCRRSDIIGRGKASGSRMEDRSLKKRRTKFNVVQGTPKDLTCEKRRRTRPEYNSSIRRLSKTPGNGRGGRTEKWRLERKEADREIIRRSLRLEIAKLMIMSIIGLREPGDGTLWKCRPPQKRKR
jgi:hypothetical protein